MHPPVPPDLPEPARPPSSRPSLSVSAKVSPQSEVDGRAVCALVRAALSRAELPGGGEVAVRFVGRDEIAALNRRFRGKPEPTDVLSFSYGGEVGRSPGTSGVPATATPATFGVPGVPGGIPGDIIGDIAVCPAVVRENARADGEDPAAMLAHAVVHGALHLAGRDHDTPETARQMASEERRALAQCGFFLNTRPAAPAAGRGIPPLQRRAQLRRSGVEPPTGTIHPRNKHRAQARELNQPDAGASESSVPPLERRDEHSAPPQ